MTRRRPAVGDRADEAHRDGVAGLVLGRAGGAHDQRRAAGDVDLVAGVAAEVAGDADGRRTPTRPRRSCSGRHSTCPIPSAGDVGITPIAVSAPSAPKLASRRLASPTNVATHGDAGRA